MPRVAGITHPGTVSFDLTVLQDGEPLVEQVFESGSLSQHSGPCCRRSRATSPMASSRKIGGHTLGGIEGIP
jgi:hypothetical protein